MCRFKIVGRASRAPRPMSSVGSVGPLAVAVAVALGALASK